MGYVRGQGMRNNKAYHKQAEEIWWLFCDGSSIGDV
jgi:hypothetical protein